MATYTVRKGDSPASIARKYTGNPARMSELVSANVQKPRGLSGPTMTFKTIHIGEKLQLPHSWTPQGLGAFGLGDAQSDIEAATIPTANNPQTAGDYVSAMTNIVSALTPITTDLSTLQAGDATLATSNAADFTNYTAQDATVTSATAGLNTNSSVTDAQTAYNTALAAAQSALASAQTIAKAYVAGAAGGGGTVDPTLGPLVQAIIADTTVCSGTPPIASVVAFQTAAGISPADGKYGPATAARALTANGGVAPTACSQYLSGGTSTTPLTPTAMTILQAYTNLTSDESLCTPGPTVAQTVNQNVLNFQHAYNTQSPAPATPLTEDGIFGPATLVALNAYSTGYFTFSGACANGILAYTAATTAPPAGTTPLPTPTPNAGTLPASFTSSSSSSTATTVLYGGILLAAAAGAYLLLRKHGASPMTATHPAKGGKKALSRGRRRTRKAARRRRR